MADETNTLAEASAATTPLTTTPLTTTPAKDETDTVCVKHVGSFLVSSVTVEGITFETGKCVCLSPDKAKKIIAKAATSGVALEIGQ